MVRDKPEPAAEPSADRSRGDTAAQRIVAAVLEGLRNGRYRPGQRLVVAELAEQLGTSAIPVREALHILSGQEIVELRPQRGARIRELSSKEILDTLRIWPLIARLNFELAAQALQLKEQRHGYAAEIEQIRAIRAQVERAYERRISLELFDAIQRLYEVTAAINGNAYFSALRGPLHVELYYRQVGDVLPGPLWDRYVENILSVIESILNGDPAGLSGRFKKHHQMVFDYLSKEFARQIEP